MKRDWPRLVSGLMVAVLPFVLLGAGLRIVTARWFVRWEYGKAGFPADLYGMDAGERIRLAGVCVDYLATGADIALLADLRLDEGRVAFDGRELEHMGDVQGVYGIIVAAGAVAGAILVAGGAALLASPDERWRVPGALLRGGLLSLGLLLGVGATMVLSWEWFFVTFHRLLFEDGTWTFGYSDTLIRLFPVRFWMDVGALLVGVLAGGALVASGVGWVWGYRASLAGRRPPRDADGAGSRPGQ
jgi:integral membrane protein (TIGR01906 family)